MGFGASAGRPGASASRRRAAVVLSLTAVMLPLGILLARLARWAMGIEVTAVCGLGPAFLTSLVALAGVCLPIGLLFPLCCGMASEAGGSVAAGRIYVWEALGSAAAGLVYTLALSRLGHPGPIAAALALGAAVACVLLLSPRPGAEHPSGSAGASPSPIRIARFAIRNPQFAVPILLAGVVAASLGWLTRITWRPLQVIETVDSRYGRVTLARTPGNDAAASLFINGLLAWTWPNPSAVEATAHIPLLQSETPRRVLLIGGGVSGTAAEVLKHPVERLVYVELDPAIIDLARRRLPTEATVSLNDPRVQLVHGDGRLFVKSCRETFDVILIDLPRPYTAQINRFYTAEFYREAAARLDGRGILCFSVGATPTHYSEQMRRFLACIDQTLRTAFAQTLVVPGTEAMFLAAKRDGVLTSDPAVLADRMLKRTIKTEFLAPYEIADRMADYRLEDVRAAIDEAGTVRLNTDLAPVCYYYDAVLWSAEMGRRGVGRPWLERIEQIPTRFLWFPLCAVAVLMVFPAALRPDRNLIAGAAITATGFIVMLVEMCCLLLIQAQFGFIYEVIGGVLFAFMLGLTVGGRWATGQVASGRAGWGRFGFAAAAVAACPLVLCAAASAGTWNLPAVAAAGGFCALAFGAGLVGGAQFPLATFLVEQGSDRPGRVAGRLYGLDLLGSCAGALVTSSLLLPVLGVTMTLATGCGLGAAVLAAVLASHANFYIRSRRTKPS